MLAECFTRPLNNGGVMLIARLAKSAFILRPRIVLLALLALLLSATALVDPAQAQRKPANAAKHGSSWKQIESVVDQYFRELPGHQPFFIITQTDVEPLWAQLAKAGWNVRGEDEIMKRLPRQSEFLVRQLRTASGRKFMHNIVPKYPLIYDRFDILSNTPGGGQTAVSGIVTAVDAELTVRYMFSTAGERSWSSMLPERGRFNKPTGRIYTAESLKTVLQQLYLDEHPQQISQTGKR
jgi:hypothetical protein